MTINCHRKTDRAVDVAMYAYFRRLNTESQARHEFDAEGNREIHKRGRDRDMSEQLNDLDVPPLRIRSKSR